MYLALKTDSANSEYYLLNNDGVIAGTLNWVSGRELADGIIGKLEELLVKNSTNWDSIKGVIVFRGPGSFTGLRIGITVANSIAYAQKIPIVGEIGESWIEAGRMRLNEGLNDKQVIPEYGSEPNITKPVK